MRLQMPEHVPLSDQTPLKAPPPGDEPPVEISPPGDDPTQPPVPVRLANARDEPNWIASAAPESRRRSIWSQAWRAFTAPGRPGVAQWGWCPRRRGVA